MQIQTIQRSKTAHRVTPTDNYRRPGTSQVTENTHQKLSPGLTEFLGVLKSLDLAA